ncbi:MAG TPA: hypothetical protein QGF35_01965 [Dehalococcoidia bacterium]|nr:hypothetical protein [Dehalococcoidia bacterium]
MKYHRLAAYALALAALLSACGGGDDLEKALDEVTSRDLSIMVLPEEGWGELAEDMAIDPDSGFEDNKSAADDSLNPNDEEDDFELAGRINGYSLSFESADFEKALLAEDGILSLSSEVWIFTTEEDAERDIQRRLDELEEFEGVELDDVILDSYLEFDADIPGDQAGGIEMTISVSVLDISFKMTVAFIRTGRLVASVGIGTLDGTDVRDEAVGAANELEKRIRGVALGEIDDVPVDIPSPDKNTGPPADADPPPGVLDLSKVALGLDDLPDGFVITEEFYETSPNLEIERSFGIGDRLAISVAGTDVVFLQSTVTLFGSVFEAQLLFDFFETIPDNEAFLETLAVDMGPGATVAAARSETVDGIGEQAIAVVCLVESSSGDIGFAFMLVRVESAVAFVTATAYADNFELRDLLPLLQVEAGRLATIFRQ